MAKRKHKVRGLQKRFARGEYVPVVVKTRDGYIVIRIGRAPNGLTVIDAPRHCCDIILPEKRG